MDDLFALPDAAIDPPDPASPADEALIGSQELARASAAIADLPARLKEVLLLRTIEGMSQAETAASLGISDKAVETRLYRARKILSAALGGSGGFLALPA